MVREASICVNVKKVLDVKHVNTYIIGVGHEALTETPYTLEVGK